VTSDAMSSNDNEILVRFVDSTDVSTDGALLPPAAEDAETQSLWPSGRNRKVKDVSMKLDQLTSQLNGISKAIQGALNTPAPPPGQFHVESFDIGLAITASGKIALVAEVGVEASITVTFKRSSPPT
jgi:hypothetical protein